MVAKLFPSMDLKAIRDATIAYIAELEELKHLATQEEKIFFDYVVKQEQSQADALSLLTQGDLEQATTILKNFLEQSELAKWVSTFVTHIAEISIGVEYC